MAPGVEAELLWDWLRARSIARGLPAPVAAHGGMLVETGAPDETRRYVFAAAVPALRELAQSIAAPLIPIKLCGHGEQLLSLVSAGWRLQPQAYLMTHAGALPQAPALPPSYRLELAVDGPLRGARILAGDGVIAASGYAVEHGGVFVFDRIATAAPHRRRGLGSVLMAALAATQQSGNARRILVATEDGRALYARLGWSVLSPYSTVVRETRPA